MSQNDPLLRVHDLKVHFKVGGGILSKSKTVRAVDGVSFDLQPGETLGLVGESGSGKSTTGGAILQKHKLPKGAVEFKGEDVTSLRGGGIRRVRQNMQMVFQNPYASLSPKMRVLDIIAEPLYVHNLARSKAEVKDKVAESLEVVGLPASTMERYPRAFSGGQRQRVGIARALILRPEFIVADEPVAALDVSVQAQVMNILGDLQKELGLSYLFISHDLAVVRHISHRIAIMYSGQIVELAAADEIYNNPKHPYTKALLSAVPLPDPTGRERERIILSGEPASPIDIPQGCRFASRCPWARPGTCDVSAPALREVDGSLVACHFAEELSAAN